MTIKIALIGPECSGKTTLSQLLARHFNGTWIPEYAREYIINLSRHYTIDDLENIARVQLRQLKTGNNCEKNIIFFDTDLIITKVWYEVVYGQCPNWIKNAINEKYIDFYLLCNTDIPWEPDKVRENGGIMREKLFSMYQHELELHKLPFHVVNGTGNVRLQNAINFVEKQIVKYSIINK